MKETSESTMTLTGNKPQKLYQAISLNRAKKLGEELNKFLENNNLVITIAEKKYVPVEGWQFTGMQLGLTEIVKSCEPTNPLETDDKEIKYKAVVEVINQNGTVVSRGFAWCSNKEKKKSSFEEYAIASMAQTRAIGKAYRNILGWIVKMGGYETTPAEEIDKEKMEADLASAKRKVLKAFEKIGVTDSTQMMNHIEYAIKKRTIDTIDEAFKVIESLEPRDEEHISKT